MNWQDEANQILARLEQIAPKAVRLYVRPQSEKEMPVLRRALDYWERENNITVVALKRKLGIST